MGMHVILLGNIVDGVDVLGPFKTKLDAMTWAEQHLPRCLWCVAPLQAQGDWES